MRGCCRSSAVAAALGAVLGASLLAGASVGARPQAERTDEDRLAARGVRWRPLIEESAERHGIDPLLLEALVAVESGFNPDAVSAVGAIGLMQVMPETAAHLGVQDPFDPAANLDAGTRYLASLLDVFDGDRRLAVAAYNAGAGAVRRAGGVPAFAETRRHVAKIERYLAHIHGLPLPAAGSDEPALLLRPGSVPVRLPEAPPLSIELRRDENGRIVFTNAPAGGATR